MNFREFQKFATFEKDIVLPIEISQNRTFIPWDVKLEIQQKSITLFVISEF